MRDERNVNKQQLINQRINDASFQHRGKSSMSTLTADTTPRRINCGEAEDGEDVDFVEAGRGGGFDEDLVGEEESGGEEGKRGEEHNETSHGHIK
jgi:hypothetical protein